MAEFTTRVREGAKRLLTRDSLIAAALLATTIAVVMFAFYPRLNWFDSDQIIDQARDGYVLDWWSPFAVLVLSGWFDLGGGVGAVWVAQVLLFIGGTFAVAKLFVKAPWAAATTLIVVLWPTTLGQLATLSRDVFSMGFALLAIAALGKTLRVDPAQRGLWIRWIVVTFVLAAGAFLTRQNAIVIAICAGGAIALAWAAARPEQLKAWRRAGAVAACALAAGLGALFIGQVVEKVTNARSVHPERVTMVYDLFVMSEKADENLFPGPLVRAYAPGRVTPVVNDPIIEAFNWTNVLSAYSGNTPVGYTDEVIAQDETPTLRRAWLRAIRHHPWDYTTARARLVFGTVGLNRHPSDAYLGILPNVPSPPRSSPWAFDAAESYLSVFTGPDTTISLDYTWMYLLVVTGIVVFLLRRRVPDRLLAIAIGVSIWLNLAILFVAAPAISYRYVNLMVPLTLLLGVWALSVGPLKRAAQVNNGD